MSIEYNGRNPVLEKLSFFDISQDAFDLVRLIGPSRFIASAKDGKIYTLLRKQYIRWLMKCPDHVKETLRKDYGEAHMEDDPLFWFSSCANFLTVIDLMFLVGDEKEWCNTAPRMLKFLLERILNEGDMSRFVWNALKDYVKEAVEFLQYAGFLE